MDWGGTAFVKPCRDRAAIFAQVIADEPSLLRYLDQVAEYYDAILMQPVVSGLEYRVFLLDGEVLYSARKYPPVCWATASVRFAIYWLHTMRPCARAGFRRAFVVERHDNSLDTVLPNGCERWEIPGRMNLSAGGTMVLESPRSDAAIVLARNAVQALGLRVAAADLFTGTDGDPLRRCGSSRSTPTPRSGCWKKPTGAI